MGKTGQLETRHWRRPIALALAALWLAVGVLPGWHQHDSDLAADGHVGGACHDSGWAASKHFEPQEPFHSEACGLCTKLSSFEGLERPRAPFVGDHLAERADTLSSTQPTVSSGRHGAARAPPRV